MAIPADLLFYKEKLPKNTNYSFCILTQTAKKTNRKFSEPKNFFRPSPTLTLKESRGKMRRGLALARKTKTFFSRRWLCALGQEAKGENHCFPQLGQILLRLLFSAKYGIISNKYSIF
jgi:hypothetical protein